MRDNPEVVAGIMATLEPIRDELFESARKEGRREPLDARRRRARPSSLAASIAAARRDGRGERRFWRESTCRALLRGYAVGDEVCELAGYRPVAVSPIREFMETEDPFSQRSSRRAKKWSGRAPRAPPERATAERPPVAVPDVCRGGL